MLVAAAVCPCPPLLVPEVAAGAAAELDGLRRACADAVAVLAAARPDRLLVVGPADGPEGGRYPQGTPGSFRGFGVDRQVRLGPADPASDTAGDVAGDTAGDAADDVAHPRAGVPPLPYSLAVGAWLLEHTRWAAAPVTGLAVAQTLPARRCLALGRQAAADAERVGLLVLGDGSACRSVTAPGYLDERAAPFDAAVSRALAAADTAALASLDADLAREVQAVGRAPWQVLAGAGEGAGLGGTLRYDDAPYGVGYLVASWS